MRTLRPYQIRMVESVFKEWETVCSTLIVLPTGTGKSIIFSEIVRRMHPKRSIIVAHRGELLHQAANHVRLCGLEIEMEKADLRASTNLFNQTPVVVASVQTLTSGKNEKRMTKFNPDDFGLLVLDEAHRSVSPSFLEVVKYFRKNPNLKVFGCTGSADRLDRKSLGMVFESFVPPYEIVDAINDGWLVPIEQQLVRVGALDLSSVRTTAGDLNGADLAHVLEQEKIAQGMCGAAISIIGDRKSICFTASVKQAEMCADIFNRHRPGMAVFVSGLTKEEERRVIISDFKGRVPGQLDKPQILVNCALVVEGFDVPDVSCILMNKPTKSRIVYSQSCGRGTRPLPGIVDGLNSAYERREAIAVSLKPSVLILDFVGNSGKHKLMSTADVLGGRFSEETKALALKKAEKSKTAVNMKELLKESEEEIRKRREAQQLADQARKAKLVAKVQYSTKLINPFDVYDLSPVHNSPTDHSRPVSEKQKQFLLKIGVNPDVLDFNRAQAVILKQKDRWSKSMATPKQCNVLRKFGYSADGVTFQEARTKIDGIAANGWKRPNLKPA